MNNVLIGIFIGLVSLAIIQFIAIKIKSSKVHHMEEMIKINELCAYLDQGDIDVTDDNGCNILMLATQNEFFYKKGDKTYLDVIKQGLEAGLDINQQNIKSGKTTLIYAIESSSNNDIIEYLMANGADPNILDKENNTAIFSTIKAGFEKYQIIISKINNINLQDNDGFTILMRSVSDMKLQIIDDLLNRGANVEVTNNKAENAYDLAIESSKHFYKKIIKSNTDEGTHHDTSNADEKRIRQYNHDINEMKRRLKCILDDELYKYKKFKR